LVLAAAIFSKIVNNFGDGLEDQEVKFDADTLRLIDILDLDELHIMAMYR
jgi:hypothetical protein